MSNKSTLAPNPELIAENRRMKAKPTSAWMKKFDMQFVHPESDRFLVGVFDTAIPSEVKEFIEKLLESERKAAQLEVLKEIASGNFDEQFDTYDFDGVAKELFSKLHELLHELEDTSK